MMATDGVRSLWRGLGPTLWRDIPFSAVYWMLYENTRTAIAPHVPAPCVAFASGAFSGMVGQGSREGFFRAKGRPRGGGKEGAREQGGGVKYYPILHFIIVVPFLQLPVALSWSVPQRFSVIPLMLNINPDLFQIAATLTTPFDVAKTHRQLTLSGHKAVHAGTFDVLRTIIQVCSTALCIVTREM